MQRTAYTLGVKLAMLEKDAKGSAWEGFKNLFGIGKRIPVPKPALKTPAAEMRRYFLDKYDYRHLKLPTYFTTETGIRVHAPKGKVIYETAGDSLPLTTDFADMIYRS